jgi:tight adherence protein C
MSVPMAFASGLIVAASLLVAMGIAGFWGSLPKPSLATLPTRRREALSASGLFQFVHPLILYLAARNTFYPVETRNNLEVKLRRAGRPCDYSAEEYLAICQISAIVCGLLSGVYGTLIFGLGGVVAGLVAVVFGYVGPLFVLNEWVNSRITKLVLKLPYAIDLLALCLGSGSTFVGAVEELVREGSDEPLDQEFRMFLTELSLGKTRREALLNLSDRCGIELLSGLIMALIQGEEQGIHVADILKRQATHIRAVRVALADEKAQKASTKILFPTMLIVMSVLLILFGSFIVKILRGKVLSD